MNEVKDGRIISVKVSDDLARRFAPVFEVMKSGQLDRSDMSLVCKLQDAYGRSSREDWLVVYTELYENEMRRRFLWVAFSVLDPDMAMDVARWTALETGRIKLNEELEGEMAERMDKVFDAEKRLEESKKAVYKRLAQQRKTIAGLRESLEMLLRSQQQWHDKAQAARELTRATEARLAQLTTELVTSNQLRAALKALLA